MPTAITAVFKLRCLGREDVIDLRYLDLDPFGHRLELFTQDGEPVAGWTFSTSPTPSASSRGAIGRATVAALARSAVAAAKIGPVEHGLS